MVILMSLLIIGFVPMIDPLNALGYLVAGFVAKTWWTGAICAAVWILFVNVVATAMFGRLDGMAFRPVAAMMSSIAAALLAVGIFSIRRARANSRASKAASVQSAS
jgi:hypothetical protein